MNAGQKAGVLFVISAPSGAGKTSLIQALLEQDATLSVAISHTTRPKRPGEKDGIDYHFVDAARFQEMVERGDFAEHAEVFGNDYGTSKNAVQQRIEAGHDLILEIDWQGARQVRNAFPDCVSIFILPPSIDALRDRLNARGSDEPDVIDRRMQSALVDVTHYNEYEYLIVNNDFTKAQSDLSAIVRAVLLRLPVQARRAEHCLQTLLNAT